jgi:hypothetical protein
MASYAEEHGSFAQEHDSARQTAHHSRQTLRTDPSLQAFFSANIIVDDAARQTLAASLREHQTQLNASVIEQMLHQLTTEMDGSSKVDAGVGQLFLDSLDRVPLTRLKKDDTCAICAEAYLDDQWPLVVELRCRHRFDLDCISPWLKLQAKIVSISS